MNRNSPTYVELNRLSDFQLWPTDLVSLICGFSDFHFIDLDFNISRQVNHYVNGSFTHFSTLPYTLNYSLNFANMENFHLVICPFEGFGKSKSLVQKYDKRNAKWSITTSLLP